MLILILEFSIILSLICSIPAWCYSCETSRSIESGDQNGAEENSRKSRQCNIASTVFLVLGVVLLIIIIVANIAIRSG